MSQFFGEFCVMPVKMIITGIRRKEVWEYPEVGGLGVPGRSQRLFSGRGHGGTEIREEEGEVLEVRENLFDWQIVPNRLHVPYAYNL